MSATSDRGPLRRAVDRAATAGRHSRTPADVAALELARLYADQLDRAELLAGYALELIRDGVDWSVGERKLLDALRDAVQPQEVAAQLGPKLLAALQQLMLTPAARSTGKDGKANDADPATAALRVLRGGRHAEAARQHHT